MSHRLRVLVVDDERISRHATVQHLLGQGYIAEAAENGYLATQKLGATAWDVLLTDLRMPGMSGLDLLREAKRHSPDLEVIVMTAYGTVETAVAALKQGAADYLTKPFSLQELEARLERLEEVKASQLELRRLRALLDDPEAPHGILGRCPALVRVRERLELFARSRGPVLVTGETGTGKELVARAVHERGPRRSQPFVAVACGAIPKELAESELFGHAKGAFTGAVHPHPGLFEQANGGTLLLDDVDDLPLEIQVKLLRVLQEGTLRRVGGTEDVTVDVRLVATTKVDLSQAVAAGRFREDLFYRLRGLELVLPPLRERGEDVLLLAQSFLRRLAAREGHTVKQLTPELAEVLRSHSWPGNVRELFRVLETAVTLAGDGPLGLEALPDYLRNSPAEPKPYTLHLRAGQQVRLPAIVEQFETELVQWALRLAGGQQIRAAELLGIPRTTLQSKLGRPR